MKSFKGVVGVVSNYISGHKFGILTGLVVAGFSLSIVETVRTTKKVMIDLADAQYDYEENGGEGELPKREQAKIIVKDSIGAGLVIGTTIGLMGLQYFEGSTKIKNSLLAINALTEAREIERIYTHALEDRLGENKAKKVRDEINQELVDRLPYDDGRVEITGEGNTLMCDAFGERFFRSSVESVLKGFDKWKRTVVSGQEDFVNYNELYYYWNLKYNQAGNILGCFADNFPDELKKTTCVGPNNEPCLVWYIDDEYLSCEVARA